MRLRTAAVAALVLVLVTAAMPASADGGSGPVAQQIICGLNHRAVQESSGGVTVISRPNPFGTTQRMCVQVYGSRPGFRILTSLRRQGSVEAYPFTGVGCAYSLCSRGTDLPRRVQDLSAATDTSWTWWGTTNGFWNASYDIWFDTRDQVTTQDNGAELMIWLRTPPGYRPGRLVWVDGNWFWFTHWVTGHRVCHAGRCCQVGSPPRNRAMTGGTYSMPSTAPVAAAESRTIVAMPRLSSPTSAR